MQIYPQGVSSCSQEELHQVIRPDLFAKGDIIEFDAKPLVGKQIINDRTGAGYFVIKCRINGYPVWRPLKAITGLRARSQEYINASPVNRELASCLTVEHLINALAGRIFGVSEVRYAEKPRWENGKIVPSSTHRVAWPVLIEKKGI